MRPHVQSAFVWGAWAFLAAAALAFVVRYGSNVPYLDDWPVVPRIIWRAPILDWLWEPVNEHRLPGPRLLLMVLFELSKLLTGSFDFRCGMFFNVVALAALAAAMIYTARALRGRTSWTDAFFPLLLLNWGHCTQLLYSAHTHFVLSVVLQGGLLLVLARWGDRLTPGPASVVGAGLLLLALCGMNCIAYLPALALWVGYMAFLCRHAPQPGTRLLAPLPAALAAGAVLAVALSFRGGAERSFLRAADPDPVTAAETALQFLTLNAAPLGDPLWPYSGLAVGLLLAATAALLVRRVVASPPERARALGVLLFLGGVVCLAAGIGWARPGLHGNPRHYHILAAPPLFGVYFAWLLYGPRMARAVVPASLFLLLVLTASFNVREGLAFARSFRSGFAAFERDALAEQPSYLLLARHTQTLLPGICDQDYLEGLLLSLRDAGVGASRSVRDNPPFEEVRLPVEPAAVSGGDWKRGTFRGAADAHLIFALPEPRFVCGVRLKGSYADTQGATFRLAWCDSTRGDFPETPLFTRRPLPEGEKSLLVYVGDTIDRFQVFPDKNPFSFRLTEVILLVPADTSARR